VKQTRKKYLVGVKSMKSLTYFSKSIINWSFYDKINVASCFSWTQSFDEFAQPTNSFL